MKNSITLNGFNDYICTLEAIGLSKVFQAYSELGSEDIQEIGFNPNSGYVYLALENGIQIASAFGHDVEYIVYNFDNGEEYFFSTYEEAETFNPYENIEK